MLRNLWTLQRKKSRCGKNVECSAARKRDSSDLVDVLGNVTSPLCKEGKGVCAGGPPKKKSKCAKKKQRRKRARYAALAATQAEPKAAADFSKRQCKQLAGENGEPVPEANRSKKMVVSREVAVPTEGACISIPTERTKRSLSTAHQLRPLPKKQQGSQTAEPRKQSDSAATLDVEGNPYWLSHRNSHRLSHQDSHWHPNWKPHRNPNQIPNSRQH